VNDADERRPAFLERMHQVFASERSNQFLLVGNIHDLIDAISVEGERYQALLPFLVNRLASRGHAVAVYDVGRGLRFAEDRDRRDAASGMERSFGVGKRTFDARLRASREDPAAALYLLADRTACETARPLSVVLRYAELLIPAGEPGHLPDHDRRRLALVRDWLGDPRLLGHSGAIILLAETAAAVNASVRDLPHLTQVELPLPGYPERRAYLADNHPAAAEEDELDTLAMLTAGMALTDLRSLLCDARLQGGGITRAQVLEEVNRLIQARIGEHIELVEPEHSLGDVLGQAALKEELERQRRLLAADDPVLAPVGILAAGPNGAGKTYLFTAWAGACGRLAVILKNLRGSYFGETDRIFEQVRAVLEALGQVIVLIDEADTQFAAPGPDTHETEARLFGNLIRMMGAPRNRGRIVWVLLTARPERLAPDLKRAGRCGLHLPVFDPEGEDREEFLAHCLAAVELTPADLAADLLDLLRRRSEGFAAADYQELADQLRAARHLAGPGEDWLRPVLEDFRPAELGAARADQIRQALAHCTRRQLIPPSLRGGG